MLAHSTFGQGARTVTGTIVDETGKPLVGANVLIKGTMTGTVANIEGKFSIDVPAAGNNILVFSFIGYVAQEIAVTGQTSLSVTLVPSSVDLDEVVVVGYGVQKKVHLTGAVSQISAKEVLKAPAANVSHMLVGKIPGVLSSQNNGAPGGDGVTFQVRGYSSWEGSKPLILVDGIERDFNNIDPNDIENVSVLKDGAAAVYGFRAADGVILVTTKRGSQGESRPSISYSGSVSLSKNTRLPKFMNGTEYMQWYNRARELDGQLWDKTVTGPKFTDEEIAMTQNGDPTDGYENTNWLEPMEKASPMHQHNLQVRGSTKNVRYFVSGGFRDQRGFFRDFKQQTTNLRSNVDVDVNKYITVSLDLGAGFSRYYRPGANDFANFGTTNNVVAVMMAALPFVPLEYKGLPASGYRTGSNPLYAKDHSGYNQNKKNTVQSKANLEFRVPGVEGLKANFMVAYDFMDQDGMTFTYTYQLQRYVFTNKSYTQEPATNLSQDGALYQGTNRNSRMILRPSISYGRKFGKHDVAALALFERTDYRESDMNAQRRGFVIFENPQLNFGTPSGTSYTNGGKSSQTLVAGYVGRLNYAYASKYLAEFSFRYDGSYKFAPDYRWGFFPSLSAGWVISEESFFNVALINRLKIRASASRLGNDTTPADLWRRLYVTGSDSPVTFGGTDYKILNNNNTYLATDLTWAKTDTYNLGAEFTLWNGVLSGEVDVFYKHTLDILQTLDAAFPPSLGENHPTRENSGEFAAKGFEVLLRHTKTFGDFSYSVTGNLSYAANKILKKTQSATVLPWQDVIGTSVGDYLGYKAIGLARTQEDLEHASFPTPGQYDTHTVGLGEILYEDLNGDGKIDGNDQTWIARASMPKMIYSFSVDLAWKGFDFSAQFQGAGIKDNLLCGTWYEGMSDRTVVADNTPMTRMFYGGSDNTPLYLIEGAWRPDNPNGKYPVLSARSNAANSGMKSDFWKVNGAYLRLKQLTLGYTLPKRITSAARIDNLRIYVAGTNLLTFSEFKYLDPEAPNTTVGYYPQQKTYSVGLNLTF